MGDYYVYVYIDPRNFEEFYYGKGKDRRMEAHLADNSSSEKAKRIRAIRKEGRDPTIRVIASGLSEHEALLVEKTLLWKLGKNLLNDSTGSGGFAKKVRPDDKMHLDLSGFDYVTGIYYFTVGQGMHRQWSDCKRLGFISAGQGVRWKNAISKFREGDIFAAYLSRHGYVGIGRIKERAKPIYEVVIDGRPLLSHDLDCDQMGDNVRDPDRCEYVAAVEWIKSVDAADAKWSGGVQLYRAALVRASLEGQPVTLRFLEDQFKVNLNSLRERRAK